VEGSLDKKLEITEKTKLQFRLEFFNLFIIRVPLGSSSPIATQRDLQQQWWAVVNGVVTGSTLTGGRRSARRRLQQPRQPREFQYA